jgi:NADPH-dependent glutamate synthase beta subunit-like oxidoreductase
MLCVVKERKSDRLLPACSTRAESDMEIITDDDEIRQSRKATLELLLSEHVGDCEGPCRTVCPAGMNIPEMIQHIRSGQYLEALKTVKKRIALPGVMGYVCPAPCEKACKRKAADTALSIKELKRFVAEMDLKTEKPYIPSSKRSTGKKVAIVGSGPTGLSTAYHLLREGHACVLYENHPKPGGGLRYGVSEEDLPCHILDSEIEVIEAMGAKILCNMKLGKDIAFETLKKEADALILALGNDSIALLSDLEFETTDKGIKVHPATFETNQTGIFAGGGIVRTTRVSIKSLAQGQAIARSVHRYLTETDYMELASRFEIQIGKLKEDEIDAYFLQGIPKSDKQKAIHEIMNQDDAILEAGRCLRCDCLKSNICSLRLYAEAYEANAKKYHVSDRKSVTKIHQHDKVIYEPGKCIKCGLCVRITAKEKERLGLTFIGRGFDVHIGVPLQETMDKGLEKVAHECVEACPTGALAFYPNGKIEKKEEKNHDKNSNPPS